MSTDYGVAQVDGVFVDSRQREVRDQRNHAEQRPVGAAAVVHLGVEQPFLPARTRSREERRAELAALRQAVARSRRLLLTRLLLLRLLLFGRLLALSLLLRLLVPGLTVALRWLLVFFLRSALEVAEAWSRGCTLRQLLVEPLEQPQSMCLFADAAQQAFRALLRRDAKAPGLRDAFVAEHEAQSVADESGPAVNELSANPPHGLRIYASHRLTK